MFRILFLIIFNFLTAKSSRILEANFYCIAI